MDAITVIKRDHRAVSIQYLRLSKTDDPVERMRIAEEIFDALEMHAVLEEEIFYPAVRAEGNQKAQNMIEDSLAEHAEIKSFIERLRLEEDERAFHMKVDELMAGVMHHVREEEAELLPAVDFSISRARLEELGEQMDLISPSQGETLGGQLLDRAETEFGI